MSIHKSMADATDDLEKGGHLIRIKEEVDPDLEMALVHRRVFDAGGPALLFERVKGSRFPAISNLFGTIDRAHYLFRHTRRRVESMILARANPPGILKHPGRLFGLPLAGMTALPMKSSNGPVLTGRTTITELPATKSYPKDGGRYITLPQVCTEDPDKPGILKTNTGMYRVQLTGNRFEENQEIGLHYQIHRGIGFHHSRAIAKGQPLKVSIFVGGPPAHSFAAVMPLPEGLPEVAFAGALAGRRFRYAKKDGYIISLDADFCITGTITDQTKPEGPFGDHLGYYSLKHPFPLMKVDTVYHRRNAVWPFTVVGRPPQEDTIFGQLIHELTGPMVPVSIAGLKEMHAVDRAGVHPLLIAIGYERYVPYDHKNRKPAEILTVANAILGFGQASLAKYLFICAAEDNPELDTHNIEKYFEHVLERVDFRRDIHFQTSTTMDTLDYSGTGLNEGSKVVIAAAGRQIRTPGSKIPAGLKLPAGFKDPRVVMKGVMTIQGPQFRSESSRVKMHQLAKALSGQKGISSFPLVVVCDDSEFTARNTDNWLWVTFTRSNPSHDIYGANEKTEFKHWSCDAPLIIDARLKPHHAWPLEDDPAAVRKAEELAAPGKSLHGVY